MGPRDGGGPKPERRHRVRAVLGVTSRLESVVRVSNVLRTNPIMTSELVMIECWPFIYKHDAHVTRLDLRSDVYDGQLIFELALP